MKVNIEITSLYEKVLKDVFEEREGSKQMKLKELEGKIYSLNEKLRSLDDKWLNNSIGDNDYKRMATNLKEDLERIEGDRSDCLVVETNYESHFKYGVNLISNLSYYYKLASIEVKQLIVGSIFPQNLIFEDDNYRTIGENFFLSVICSESNKSY